MYSNLAVRQPLGRNNSSMVKSIGVNSALCDGHDIKKIYQTFNTAIEYVKKIKNPFFRISIL